MSEQDRLGVLHVGAPGHGCRAGRLGLGRDGIDEFDHESRDAARMIEQVEPDERRNLVVAASTGAKLAAELGSGDVHESAL